MSLLSIYSYNSVSVFLNDVLDNKKRYNSKFSLRAWAKQLGIKAPIELSRVLNRQRKISKNLLYKVAQNLQMNIDEERYFVLLSLSEETNNYEAKKLYYDYLSMLNPLYKQTLIDKDHFEVISKWYHFPLMEMSFLKDVTTDCEYLSYKLGGLISADEIEKGLLRLERLGIIEIDIDKKTYKKKKDLGQVKTGDDGVNIAIQKYHQMMIQKANNALEKQSVKERDFTANTITIEDKSLPKFRELIRVFHKEVSKLSAPSGSGDNTYQFNVQLFNLTTGK